MIGSNAVLPPRTGWGFEPSTSTSQQQQEDLAKASSNPFESPSDGRKNLKRRNDCENESESAAVAAMHERPAAAASDCSPLSRRPSREVRPYANNKRARVHVGLGSVQTSSPRGSSRQNLPVRRVIESLNRKGLEELIEKLCQNHGEELVDEISALAPKVTVNLALENLKSTFDQVCSAFPYRGNQQGDYAYYRVKSHLDEFFTALVDYTLNFLPPAESIASNSLAYLDGATKLLCDLPDWDNPVHNHAKHSMLDEFSGAWIVALKEASKSSNGLGLMFQHGWERKLEHYNEASHNRLVDALGYLRQELAWANDMATAPTTPSPHTIRVANHHDTFFL